ncbi:MAG: AAA family ATPase, partial [Acidimicrobiia bacterium]
FDVLVIDDLTSYLSRRLVQQTQSAGKAVLGVFDRNEFAEGEKRLRSLGVDGVTEATASPEEFLRVIGKIRVDSHDDSSRSQTAPDAPGPMPIDRPTGLITAVGGPSGGVGRTEVALAIAVALRYRGTRTALVDADDQSPSIAQRLGLSLHPNLRTAVDALHHRSGTLHSSLSFPRHLAVDTLVGLANPRDWIELRPGDVVEVIRELADEWDQVVVDIGARVEDLAYHGGSDRNGLARAVLSASDEVIVVGSPSPVGVARILDWLADTATLLSDTPIHCVFNRASRSSFQRNEIMREFTRSFSPTTLTFVPDDRRVLEAAWAGEPVPGGPFTRSIAEVVESRTASWTKRAML